MDGLTAVLEGIGPDDRVLLTEERVESEREHAARAQDQAERAAAVDRNAERLCNDLDQLRTRTDEQLAQTARSSTGWDLREGETG